MSKLKAVYLAYAVTFGPSAICVNKKLCTRGGVFRAKKGQLEYLLGRTNMSLQSILLCKDLCSGCSQTVKSVIPC